MGTRLPRGYVASLGPKGGEAPQTQVDFVSISDPTTVQHGPFLFRWGQARYSELRVEVDLLIDDFLNDAYPGYRFDPKTTPGAF